MSEKQWKHLAIKHSMKIKSRNVWYHDRFQPCVINLEGNRISAVDPYGRVDIDFGGLRIVPGFIDIHCHGAYGFDTDSGDPEGLKYWAGHILEEGVTSFLPTTITEKKEVLIKALSNVAEVMSQQNNRPFGAHILGIHFEGPYLNKAYKGAQPEEAIAEPSTEEFKEYQKAAQGHIKIVTLAPENDKDFALIRYLAETGVIASIGHTAASYETACDALKHGARSFTHTYNAMSPFGHRSNGAVGAALRNHDTFSEIICDCSHSTPAAINIFYTCKNDNRAIMVSDALMCKGYEPGSRFLFGGQEIVIYPDGSAHLAEADNHPLAGSTMKINEGLRNAVERADVPFAKAIKSCTCNPAELLGIDHRKGYLETGYDADLTVLNNDWSVNTVFCGGKMYGF